MREKNKIRNTIVGNCRRGRLLFPPFFFFFSWFSRQGHRQVTKARGFSALTFHNKNTSEHLFVFFFLFCHKNIKKLNKKKKKKKREKNKGERGLIVQLLFCFFVFY